MKTHNKIVNFMISCIGNRVLKHRQLKKFRKHIIKTQNEINSEPFIFMFTNEQRGIEDKD